MINVIKNNMPILKTKVNNIKEFLHTIPRDLRGALGSNPLLYSKWQALTPIAKNEWICFIITVKKKETRKKHLDRLCRDLQNGKKRPCCWSGCPHRRSSL